MRLRRHPFRLLILTFTVGFISLVAARATPVYACSCAMPPGADEAQQQADAVFLGNVAAVDQHIEIPPRKIVRLTRSFPFVSLEQQ